MLKRLALCATSLVVAGLLATMLVTSAGAAGPGTPAADCQPFGKSPCLLPFPNNLFTRPDRSTPTGLRINLPSGAMPKNVGGQRISVAPYNRNDGFSPGSAMIVHVPGLDNAQAFARTGAVQLADMGQTFAKDQPIVVIDQSSGRRQLIYSQLDANADSPQATDLMIIPGKELTEGHTYVVALRRLRNASGQLIAAPAWFQKLRDGRGLPANERSQRGRYAQIFAALKRAGISSRGLYEAWNFTVASAKNLTSRLLAIRNGAFGQLGDHNLANRTVEGRAPSYTVTSTTRLTAQLNEVQGTFATPCYLVTCGPTATGGFHYGSSKPDALPTQIPANTATAPFACIVPASASASRPARVSLYGHGLLGSHAEVTRPWVEALATNYNMAFCATDWWGLASGDTAFDAKAIANLNLFPVAVDRLQQGVLNTLYLGRAMINPGGFASNPAFQLGGRPLIDTSHLYYDGNSQGGIEGG